MLTGQLLVIAVLIAVWIALVSSCTSSPIAPPDMLGQRTSSQGRPEHINTSPFRVAAPVVDNVEKLPGDCALAGLRGQVTASRLMAHATIRVSLIPVS